MNVSFIGTENALTVVFADLGKSYNVDSSNPNWDTIISKLTNEDYEGLEELLSVKKAVETFFESSSVDGIIVDDSGVKYNGAYVHNYLTDKILDFMKRGLPTKPLIKFFEKVMKNPSYRAVNELYKFLEHGSMPITPEGNFLGYKSVRLDYMDWYSNTFRNQVGDAPKRKQRNEVCDDPDIGCSEGYHVGTLGYAKDFYSGNNRIMIVEVDPSDVVSVPHDYQYQKLRTMFYKVVGELFDFEKPLDNDYSAEYNTEEEDKEAEREDLESQIESLRDHLTNNAGDMSVDELQEIVENIDELEQELEALEEEDEECEGADCPYHNCRDDKGRFCKKQD